MLTRHFHVQAANLAIYLAFFYVRIKQLTVIWTDDASSIIVTPANSYPMILEEVSFLFRLYHCTVSASKPDMSGLGELCLELDRCRTHTMTVDHCHLFTTLLHYSPDSNRTISQIRSVTGIIIA